MELLRLPLPGGSLFLLGRVPIGNTGILSGCTSLEAFSHRGFIEIICALGRRGAAVWAGTLRTRTLASYLPGS